MQTDSRTVRWLRALGRVYGPKSRAAPSVPAWRGLLAAVGRQQVVAGPRRASAPEVPSLRVLMLGEPGSGKTTLLASMFYRMSRPSRRGMVLSAPTMEHIELSRLLAQIIDPDEAWPMGSEPGEARRYEFKAAGRVNGGFARVVDFSYVDYGGAALEAVALAEPPAITSLAQQIATAQALWVMIDGSRLAQALDGSAAGRNYLAVTIPRLVSALRGSRGPISLIVSKWDLLAPNETDDERRLGEVTDALLAQPGLARFVDESTAQNQIVRLIPVSAVGRRFVEPGHDIGLVSKRLDPVFEPLNVEVPLSAVLPDLFTQIEAELDRAVHDQIEAEVRVQLHLAPAESATALARFLSRPAGLALRVAANRVVGPNAINDRLVYLFLDWLQLRRGNGAGPDVRVEGERRAQRIVLEDFADTMAIFSRRFGPTVLTSRRPQ